MSPLAKLPAATAGANPLAGLRGYHLPGAISWWPPAPGWWLLALLVLALAAMLAWWLSRRHRRRAAARAAERELEDLRARLAEGGDAGEFVRNLSVLLRRYAIRAYPRREVAALTGEQWLRFLDSHGGDGGFSAGAGRALVELPYRPHITPDAGEQMARLVEAWIRRNREVAA
jgi:hypothetical protein